MTKSTISISISILLPQISKGASLTVKLIIDKAALLHLVTTVSKAVAVRTPKPVLTGILLQCSDTDLTATAYDMELGIQDVITINPEEPTYLEIQEEGSIVLPGRHFLDVIRKLPSSSVLIETSLHYMTQIISGSSKFILHGMDAAEFPKLPTLIANNTFTIPGTTLQSLIQSTSFATSNSEVRPVLTGLHAECRNEALSFTATDGLRLATKRYPVTQTTSSDWVAVLPGKSLNELAKLIPETSDDVTIQLSQSHSLFLLGTLKFYTRLLDGAYPDTSRLIPSQWKTQIHTSRQDLLGAIDRASLIARDRENHRVSLQLQQNTLVISSSSPEIGNVQEFVSVEARDGDDLQIAFNGRYVMDALRALDGEKVNIRFNGANQPFTLHDPDFEQSLQLISPMLMR